MIHLAGDKPVARALKEIEILHSEGIDGIIVENYHGDVETVRLVLSELSDYKGALGVNILPNNFAEAFYLSDEYGADFIQLDYIAGAAGDFFPLDIRSNPAYAKCQPHSQILFISSQSKRSRYASCYEHRAHLGDDPFSWFQVCTRPREGDRISQEFELGIYGV